MVLTLYVSKLNALYKTNKPVTLLSAIKKRMEKDIDEVGKIAHGVKTKIEAISRDVLSYWLNIVFSRCQFVIKFQMNMKII